MEKKMEVVRKWDISLFFKDHWVFQWNEINLAVVTLMSNEAVISVPVWLVVMLLYDLHVQKMEEVKIL